MICFVAPRSWRMLLDLTRWRALTAVFLVVVGARGGLFVVFWIKVIRKRSCTRVSVAVDETNCNEEHMLKKTDT